MTYSRLTSAWSGIPCIAAATAADAALYEFIPLIIKKKILSTPRYHIKLSIHIPNKKEFHITAHASTPVLANELPVYPGKSSM